MKKIYILIGVLMLSLGCWASEPDGDNLASLQASNIELREMLKTSMDMNVKMQAQIIAETQGGNNSMQQSLADANKTTVDTIKSFAYILVSIVTSLCGAATTIVTVIMKGSRDRALKRADDTAATHAALISAMKP